MTLLGLDFDNTLVRYDKLFHQIAVEKGLIEHSLPADKIAIRDYLRNKGQDEQFTMLQGEVYGLRILEAEPAEGMLEALKNIKKLNIEMVLISHKTKKPYKGPAYDLRKGALKWLEKYNFFSDSFLSWTLDNINFEETKIQKIGKIQKCQCTHYIDDLEDILAMIPSNINRIHYSPNKKSNKDSAFERFSSWHEIQRYFDELFD